MAAVSDHTSGVRATRRAVMLGGVAAMLASQSLIAPPAAAEGSVRPMTLPGRAADPAAFASQWAMFKQRFVAADGRVIDGGNGGCSHSEGQGWGMLFAMSADDPDAFDRILGWTARHLRRPSDGLHAWRWMPDRPAPVTDWNNATDGDLFIAYAMLRAGARWGRPDLAVAGAGLTRDILRLLVRKVGRRTVLLAGIDGFDGPAGVAINPSYYAFPVLDALEAAVPAAEWAALRVDGLEMLDDGRFGTYQLPPDWLLVANDGDALRPHPNWPARFSYDAVRIPLWLAWAGHVDHPAVKAFTAYWASGDAETPAWVDLVTGAEADYPASPGMLAIAALTAAADERHVSGTLLRRASNMEPPAAISQRNGRKGAIVDAMPSVRTSNDYYSAALTLLARLALHGEGWVRA